jgi:hypothetical protein
MDFALSKSNSKRMGRPPKHRVPTMIRLDRSAIARIDKALRGREKRVDLIRAAVERELNRREKNKLR